MSRNLQLKILIMCSHILIVDDELDLQRLIKQRFRKRIKAEELKFIFACDGIEALEKLKIHTDIDLVLTDINMPGMDGLTLIDKLKEIDQNLKSVVVSAYGDMKNIRIAMNRGAFDFITKPIDFEDLDITINKTLKDVQQRREKEYQLQQSQAQLIQSEKMSTLGQMIAGVAHEINNPVGFVDGNIRQAEEYLNDLFSHLELYQKQYPNPTGNIKDHAAEIDLDFLTEDFNQLLSSMRQGTERLRSISKSLRTFSRSDTNKKINFNVHEGIDSTIIILKYRLKANKDRPAIEVITDYGNLPDICCYPGQLNQVFMNLLGNAVDALDTRCIEHDYEYLELHPNIIKITTKLTEDGDRLIISIQDNGPGMTEDVRKRVFDRLFTTKSVGVGTGLGLAIAHQIIVEKHGGQLSCISSPGQGAEFIIDIPLISDECLQ